MKSYILKLAIFATGFSGVVAEYILSTLATYILGDSVVQWTLIISVMLFSMGLGSRLSKFINNNLLEYFITTEIILSILVSLSSVFVYSVFAFSYYTGFLIYSLSIIIGILIGIEIPLVIRLNDSMEILKFNISSVMEKDYYGALAGGLFFAFFGLPHLGLTYTPFVLGAVNFLVALILFLYVIRSIKKTSRFNLATLFFLSGLILIFGVFSAEEIVLNGEQSRYRDKVIFEKQTKYQKIVITEWKNNYWLYLNGNQQLSSLDEYMYHEPLVHSVMQINKDHLRVLVLGGGDGAAIREILKYNKVQKIVLVDIDPEMTTLANSNKALLSINKGSLKNEKVNIINEDAFYYLENTNDFFDVIIADLPDPRSVELSRLYSFEFYSLVYNSLSKNGVFITQAGSPYFASRAFKCIEKTMNSAGLNTLLIHNQIVTMGQWGWVIGSKELTSNEIKSKLLSSDFSDIDTRWLNKEAIIHITNFGKDFYGIKFVEPEVNKITNPVLYRYYLDGNWDIY